MSETKFKSLNPLIQEIGEWEREVINSNNEVGYYDLRLWDVAIYIIILELFTELANRRAECKEDGAYIYEVELPEAYSYYGVFNIKKDLKEKNITIKPRMEPEPAPVDLSSLSNTDLIDELSRRLGIYNAF